MTGRASGSGGRIAVARYNPNGTLDATFGGDGKITTDMTSTFDGGFSVALQAEGKIVAAGQAGGRMGLARYDTDGSLDSTFGGDGRVTTDFSARSGGIFNIAIQPIDGKIMAVGSAGGSGGRFGVARYLP